MCGPCARAIAVIFGKLELEWIGLSVLVVVVSWGTMVGVASNELTAALLKWRYTLASSTFFPEDVLFRYQMAITHHKLESTSPTEILRQRLHDDNIPALVQNSSVLDFYYDVYTNRKGVTSSTLAHSEGKTISSLSILARIEQATRNGYDWRGHKVVFLYVDVDGPGHTITEGLRMALHIMDGVDLYKVLARICTAENDKYVIYGLIDQVDRWHEDDQDALKTLVQHQSRSLHIHIPSAKEGVALQLDKTNGRKKASYEGRVTPSMEHELTTWQARQFVNALAKDCSVQERIMELASKEISHGDAHFFNPRRIAEIYEQVLRYPSEHSRECAEPKVDAFTLEAGYVP